MKTILLLLLLSSLQNIYAQKVEGRTDINTVKFGNFTLFLSEVGFLYKDVRTESGKSLPPALIEKKKSIKQKKEINKKKSISGATSKDATSEDQQLYQSAEKLFNTGDLKEAENIFIELLQKYPDFKNKKSTTYYLAEIMLRTGRPDEAEMYYNKIIYDFSRSKYVDDAYYRLAFIYSKAVTNDIKEQIINKKKELKTIRTAKDKTTVTNLENDLKKLKESLLQKKQDDYSNGLKYLSIMQEKFKESLKIGESYILKGDIYQKIKNYKQAVKAYKTVVDNYPKSNSIGEAYFRLGIIFQKIPEQRDFEKSAEYFQKLIDNCPKSRHLIEAKKELKYIKENFINYK